MQKQFTAEGADIVRMSPTEFAAYIASEIGQMGPCRQGGRHQAEWDRTGGGQADVWRAARKG